MGEPCSIRKSPLPTVVVFEDVHRADEATLDLIKFLGRGISHLPVLFLVTYRDNEHSLDHPLWSAICYSVVGNNAQDQVTWVHSYVSEDKQKTYCIYDGPSPEVIRQAARRNKLPIDRITEVCILDPYFYT